MGASESTPRKLTIPNENQFIKITDSVAERLLACKEKKINADQKKDKPCPPKEFDEEVSNHENIPPDRLKYSDEALINYYYGPSVTSLRLLQEKEKEMQESEKYWTQRINKLENHHSQLKERMEHEYHRALEEVNSQVPKPPQDAPFPCKEEKNSVVSCYTKNPKQALLCALEVSKFADCVQNKRIQSLQDPEKS